MKSVYDDNGYSHLAVVECCNKFWKGRKCIKDLTPCPGLPRVAVTDENMR